jgi:hypothetical protein
LTIPLLLHGELPSYEASKRLDFVVPRGHVSGIYMPVVLHCSSDEHLKIVFSVRPPGHLLPIWQNLHDDMLARK